MLCNVFDIDPAAIRRDVRTLSVCRKRRQIARSLRERGYSYPEIGQAMWRHHTSIMNLLNPKSKKRELADVAA